MTRSRLNCYIHLPEKVAAALVRCDFQVIAGIVMKKLFPQKGRRQYEVAVRRLLRRRFGDIIDRYEDREYPTGYLTAGASIWVFCPEDGKVEADALLQSVRKEAENRPVYILDRNNYREYVSLPDTLIKRLDRASDSVLSDLLCHALLSNQDGTYVDSRTWENAKQGDPVHNFVFDMLVACHTDRLPIVDSDLPDILIRMAEDHIPSVREKRNELDRMILQACPLRTLCVDM